MRKFLRVWAFVGTQFIVSLPTIADAPDTMWTRTFGGTGNDVGSSVQQTQDGGYIITGTTQSYSAGSFDILLIKTNEFGDTTWTKTFGGDWFEEGNSVQPTLDGGYIITGFTESSGAGGSDVLLIKTDSLGNKKWEKTFGGADMDRGYSVQQTQDDGYIMTGITESFGAGKSDFWLIKTNAFSDTTWTRTFGGSENDKASSVQQTEDNGYILTGYTRSSGAGGSDVLLIKTDSLGNEEWEKTFGGTEDDMGSSVQQTQDDGYILTGSTHSYGEGGADVYLIRINPKPGIEEKEKLRVESLELRVFPNPSFGNVLIKYGLPERADISLGLYDISGRLVKTIYSGTQEKGEHKVNVGAYHDTPTGIYFIKFETHTGLVTNNYKATRKLTIIR